MSLRRTSFTRYDTTMTTAEPKYTTRTAESVTSTQDCAVGSVNRGDSVSEIEQRPNPPGSKPRYSFRSELIAVCDLNKARFQHFFRH